MASRAEKVVRSSLSHVCKSSPISLGAKRTPIPRLATSAAPAQSRTLGTCTGASRATAKSSRVETGKRSASAFSKAISRRPEEEQPTVKRVLREDDLFHSFSESPIPEIRRRAAFMRQHAYCPHPDHRPTRLSDSASGEPTTHTGSLPAAHVDFECPDCGIPVYCNKEHWMADYEKHLEICDTLRQINEDDHDLRSGRLFPEFDFAGPQIEESMINMTNWDTLLYTRNFEAINNDRSMRQATRLLTYPYTIGSVLHELSPYSVRKGGRLTTEGLKSFSGKHIGRSFCVLLDLT